MGENAGLKLALGRPGYARRGRRRPRRETKQDDEPGEDERTSRRVVPLRRQTNPHAKGANEGKNLWGRAAVGSPPRHTRRDGSFIARRLFVRRTCRPPSSESLEVRRWATHSNLRTNRRNSWSPRTARR